MTRCRICDQVLTEGTTYRFQGAPYCRGHYEAYMARSGVEPHPDATVLPTEGGASASHGPAAVNYRSQKVVVTDIDMPIGSMVSFMIKWAIASIPALIILTVLGLLLGLLCVAILKALGMGSG